MGVGGKVEIMRRIKMWLLSSFFKRELDDIRYEYEQQIKYIQSETKRKTKMIDLVKDVLKSKNRKIIGEAINKNGDYVLVVEHVYGGSIDLLLYGENYKAINRHPRIMATCSKSLDGTTYIHIEDILVEDNEVGNGSILMPYFIEYCKGTEANYICGELSSVDVDHFDRLEHFYKKHGFDVTFDENRSSGSINYNLSSQYNSKLLSKPSNLQKCNF